MVSKQVLLLLFLTSVVTSRFEGRTEIINFLRKAPREYSIETESCCNGVIADKPSEDYDCCGLAGYIDKQYKRCCVGTVYDVDGVTECCDNVTYDKTKYACRQVARHVTPYSVDFDYTDNFYHYAPVALPESDYYCGNQSMNRNNQICCNFLITENPNGDLTECCGTRAFNPRTHGCCDEDNTIIEMPSPGGEYACCGLTIYNSTHYCSHDSNILERPKDGKVVCEGYVMDPETAICCDKPVMKTGPDDYMCCGDQTYRWGDGACCSDLVHERETYTFHEGNLVYCCGDKGPY